MDRVYHKVEKQMARLSAFILKSRKEIFGNIVFCRGLKSLLIMT